MQQMSSIGREQTRNVLRVSAFRVSLALVAALAVYTLALIFLVSP